MMVAAPVLDAASSLDCSLCFQSSGNHDMTMTRRDFLVGVRGRLRRRRRSAPARRGAPLPREADIVVIGAGAAGIAAARRIHGCQPQGDRGRSREPDRRPLPHRQRDLRGAVRSRRALAAQSRHQPDDQAGAQRRARRLGGAARARRSASAAATRAPAKPRNFWPRWCAPTAPSTTPRAARPTCPAPPCCRRISATGRGRRNSCSAPTPRARI